MPQEQRKRWYAAPVCPAGGREQTSIHSASMSPSRTIHWCLLLRLLAMSRKVTLISPSRHSRVAGFRLPYNSLRVTDCARARPGEQAVHAELGSRQAGTGQNPTFGLMGL